LYIFFLLLFTVPELILLIAKRSRKSQAKTRNDGKSLLILWVTIPLSLNAVCFISWNQIWISGIPNMLEIFGIAVYVAGFIIRCMAVYQLGRMFTVDVSISSDHVLKTNGLYTIVRHPSYLGLLLILAGLFLLANNPVCCLLIIPVFAAINYRISVEEKELVKEFGNQYALYSKRIKKIMPFIY
jgi:protein-S-isoprenylcysteine O-methyltransferase Ste14